MNEGRKEGRKQAQQANKTRQDKRKKKKPNNQKKKQRKVGLNWKNEVHSGLRLSIGHGLPSFSLPPNMR